MNTRLFLTLVSLLLAVSAPARSAAPAFPLQTAGEGRYLAGQDGAPFLWIGDDAGNGLLDLEPAALDARLAARARQGFSVVVFRLLPDTPGGKLGGLAPFAKTGDILAPVDAYWQRVDAVVDSIGRHGLVAALAPLWFQPDPVPADDWRFLLQPNNSRGYGRFVGKRYRDRAHVVWILGGASSPRDRTLPLNELAEGVKTFARQLLTVSVGPGDSSLSVLGRPAWLDFNLVHPHGEAAPQGVNEWFRLRPSLPIIWGPGAAVTETATTDAAVLRRQLWSAWMSGATSGFTVATDPKAENTPALRTVRVFRDFVSSIEWQRMIADSEHTASQTGREWEFVQQGGGVMGEVDYVAAAFGRDKLGAVAYVPIGRPLTLNTARAGWGSSGRDIDVWWIDPLTGQRHLDPRGPFLVHSSVNVAPPGPNSAGEPDWIIHLNLNEWRDYKPDKHKKPAAEAKKE